MTIGKIINDGYAYSEIGGLFVKQGLKMRWKTTISDSTVSMMMAYYYTHSTGVFTDQAKALGVDTIWDSGYSWYMNAWVDSFPFSRKSPSAEAEGLLP